MATVYRIGEVEVRATERRLLVQGRALKVGARAFDLLLTLIEHRDRMLAKDELMARVWPGVVVEENNITVQISALRKLLGHDVVATVSGRGYQFTGVVSEDSGPQAAAPVAPLAAALDNPLAAVDGAVELALPDKPSIAVLAFANLSDDPAQEFFTDGITEDIITELSRFRSLFVSARNSSFSYKGKPVDVRSVARQLGVRYVLEGSIRRAASRIRVTAQLIDAPNAAQVWAEKYDRVLEDIFAVQEELTQAIVAAIAPQIEAAELHKVRAARPGNLTAYELAMRARDCARRADKESDAALRGEAMRLAREAIDVDPRCGTALGIIAFLHWQQIWAGSASSVEAAAEQGLAAARSAIEVDSGDHVAHLWRAMLLLFSARHAAGLAGLRRAHELNPNDALTLSLLGQYEALAGDPQTGIRHVADALRLSPLDALRWSFLNSLAWAYFAAGDYASAADAASRAIDEAPRFHPPHLCLAICRVGLGDTAQARAGFDALRELAPQTVAARLSGRWTYGCTELTSRATHLLRIAAGLEEPGEAER